ncbi:TPA: hypothetical protein U2M54_002439 [Providencia rettgeri]|uniref:hypothetical protein n=1 Tax=Providencia TaxID=586 RepID=UPI0018C5B166|nr:MULTISPECIES: hypothetical protein [Providencia]MBG5929842.1 hypothetical protein [Providencia rettgeri]MBS0859325.1 hypothetical protein [Providencia rettgeri]MBS0873332.1 hypothetical protein [Providencia rettgeri]MBS0920373.1 hypothetical protein [Providencia rettgeri]MCG5371263.1 hypothetical protein [Providencia rettgeri]
MNTISHLQRGLERIAIVISILLCLWITGVLLTHFQLIALIMNPYGITLMYFVLYLLALVTPQLLAQLGLWVLSAFKGIDYKIHFSPKLVTIISTIIIGLALSSLLIIMSSGWLYGFTEGIATTILLVDLLIATGIAFYLHRRIRHWVSVQLNRQSSH